MTTTTAANDATTRLLLIQRMIARSREVEQERANAATLRRDALRRVGLEGERDDIETLVTRAKREPLIAVTPDRRRSLCRHLAGLLRAHADAPPTPVPPPVALPEPTVFAQRACSMCQGACCGGGGNRAYLTEATMRRVAAAQPDLSARGILRRYLEAVPDESVQGSCIYHSRRGCALDRSLRADICNRHYCPPMRNFIRSVAARGPRDVLVMAVGNGVVHDAVMVPAKEQT